MSRLNKKKLLDLYLNNVDKFKFTQTLGDMKERTCAVGVLGVATSFTDTPEFIQDRFVTNTVLNYLYGKGTNEKVLNKLIELNDSSSNKEEAVKRISAYLRS